MLRKQVNLVFIQDENKGHVDYLPFVCIYIVLLYNLTVGMCIGQFTTLGTSKNENFPKDLVGHRVKKFTEIWLFVYIFKS